jgi:hypothetical protein
LANKSDTHFAMNQLEMQKVKSDLSTQASTHFSINQLEQQKLGSVIAAQLADAKYEALKSQQVLAEKINSAADGVKEKIDDIDRDRLRDSLTVEKTDNNILKVLEHTRGFFDGGHYGGRHRGSRRNRYGYDRCDNDDFDEPYIYNYNYNINRNSDRNERNRDRDDDDDNDGGRGGRGGRGGGRGGRGGDN